MDQPSPHNSNQSSDKRKQPIVPLSPSKGTPFSVKASGLNALALLSALKRRWLLAACLGLPLAVVVAATVWNYSPPPRPVAAAKLHMPVDPEGVLFKHPEASSNFQNYQQTQIALIKSKMVLNAALREPKVANLPIVRSANDPVSWLEGGLKVDPSGSLEIVRVSLTENNAADLKIIVDAVVKAYLTEVVDKQKKRRRDRLEELKRLCNIYEDELKRAQDRRRASEQAMGPNNEAPLTDRLLLQQHAAVWKDLGEVRSTLRSLRWELKTFKSKAAGLGVTNVSLVDDYVDRDPLLADYLGQKTLRERDNDTLRERIKDPQNQHIKMGELKLAELKTKIEARRKELRETAEAKLRGQSENYSRASLESLEARIKDFEDGEKTLLASLEELDKQKKNLVRDGAIAEEDKSNIERATKKLDLVLDERNKLAVEFEDPARVQLLEEATATTPENDFVRKATMPGAAGAGALALVMLAVALWEYRIRRVSAPDQIVDGLGTRLLGTVPAPPTRTQMLFSGKVEKQALWQAGLTEAVDTVRTLLLYEARTEAFRALLVTSAVSGEGKTSLSTHLAISMARSGRRTLLLDCDIRCPSCHALFNMPLGPGFSELLRDEAGLDEVIRETSVPNLFLLSAGLCNRKAIEALGRSGASQWFERLKEQFDFVLIDSSPVLPVNDAVLVGQHADAVLFSVLQGVSRIPLVQSAMQKISGCGGRILGVVVSGTAAEAGGFGYGYSYENRYLTAPVLGSASVSDVPPPEVSDPKTAGGLQEP